MPNLKKILYFAILPEIYSDPPLGILSRTAIINKQAVHLATSKVLRA